MSAGSTSQFGNLASLAPPRIPKEVMDTDLIAIMTKPFTSTKGNNTLQTRMMSNRICLVCCWHRSHTTGYPRGTEHTQGMEATTTTLTASIEEVKEEEGTGFLHRGL